jgi:hypothetical protein
MTVHRLRLGGLAGALAMVALGVYACSDRSDTTAPGDEPALARGGVQGPDLNAALAAKARYTDVLLRRDGVVGTAVGIGAGGRGVVRVYLARPGAAPVPASLDGVGVETVVTGEISAVLPSARPGASAAAVPTSRFARPVPIGVSTGNLNDLVYFKTFCTAGTLGARLQGANNRYYALSNNHVFAVENLGKVGDPIIQPGQADKSCRSTAADKIGTVAAFVPLKFAKAATNTVDAAVGLVTTATVKNATPAGGYGTPSATIRTATLNMLVQKYGRTTVLTHGKVTGLDATIVVNYSNNHKATFVHQIVISNTGGTSFSGPGDSGSLIVSDNSAKNPVGLLFAGSPTTTIANPIKTVLTTLGTKLGTTLTIR